MKRTRTLRIWGGFWLLLLLLFTFLIWNIFAGSVSLSASEIWRILLGGDVDFTQSQIIMKIRLPRLLSALILGGALSLSGYLLQTFFHVVKFHDRFYLQESTKNDHVEHFRVTLLCGNSGSLDLVDIDVFSRRFVSDSVRVID